MSAGSFSGEPAVFLIGCALLAYATIKDAISDRKKTAAKEGKENRGKRKK